MRKSFTKAERLCQQYWIDSIFQQGYAFSVFPFKILVSQNPIVNSPHQILITVSKRNFKRAVDRNAIKRRIREGYRLQKQSMPVARSYHVVFIYIAKEMLSSEIIHKKIQDAMTLLTSHETKIINAQPIASIPREKKI